MLVIYNLSIRIYYLFVSLASFVNPKAKKWTSGRRNGIELIRNTIGGDDRVVWFHCASLGEFEQGRPLIDKIKRNHKEFKILVTFFSPSGYEVRKNYEHADYVFYLPIDTKKNAKTFIELVDPELVFFVKYEFWYHYLSSLAKSKIPTYLVSGSFRKDQVFFKWYGRWFKNILGSFTNIFVQNKLSYDLLLSRGISSEITGDTRFDRVCDTSKKVKEISLMAAFTAAGKTIIAGSSWEFEEKHLAEALKSGVVSSYKLIVAPHNVELKHVDEIVKLFTDLGKSVIRFSDADESTVFGYEVLVVDNIGMLSSLYQYADLAIVGGGFTGNLHNILEPATFGLPVFFGPKHDKFPEAKELVQLGGAFIYCNSKELQKYLEKFDSDEISIKEIHKINVDFILNNKGATDLVYRNTFSGE